MGYTLTINDFSDEDNVLNVSEEAFISNDDFIAANRDFKNWEKENKDYGKNSVEYFRYSNEYEQILDSFHPIEKTVHVLENEPLPEHLVLIERYASACVICKIKCADTYAIALTGHRAEDHVELAYYMIDGRSPIKHTGVGCLSQEGSELLKGLRGISENSKRVEMWHIRNIIESLQ